MPARARCITDDNSIVITEEARAPGMNASICQDCFTDTTPCTGKRGCRHTRRWEHFIVHDAVWQAAGMGDGFLCVGCLETRLGRRLTARDFTDVVLNDPDDPWHTPRLRAALTRGP